MEQPNIQKLNKFSTIITENKDYVSKTYDVLMKLSENNIKTLELYGGYLLDIENNVKEASKIYDRMIYIFRDKKKKIKKMNLDSENVAIILMSILYKDRGRVIGVNAEACKLFRYTKSEMVDQPIEKFMPKFYSIHHKDFMARFLRHGTSSILGNKRKIFILNKQSFVQSCTLFVKILSSIDEGFQVVGFVSSKELSSEFTEQEFNRRKIKYVIVYEANSGQLQYVCENSYKYLGMKSNTSDQISVFMEDSNLKVIAPKLFDPRFEKSKFVGIRLDFDTTTLKSKDRSLLKELEDEAGDDEKYQINQNHDSGEIRIHEESENFDHSEEIEAKNAIKLRGAP